MPTTETPGKEQLLITISPNVPKHLHTEFILNEVSSFNIFIIINFLSILIKKGRFDAYIF